MSGRAKGGEKLDRNMRRLIVAIVPATFLVSVDLTIVNVALDSLGKHLHSSLASVQWVVTSYSLAMAAAIPASGWLARRIGPKRLFVAALFTFTLASGLCGAATSNGLLIGFRVLQGFAAGMMLPVGQMILARAAGPARMGKVMGTVTSVNVISPILGPTIGGWIVTDLSWRWIFLVNLPIGLVGVTLALRLLQHEETEPSGSLDWVGLALLGAGLPIFTYGLAELGEGASLGSPRALPAVGLGIGLVAVFVLHALRSRNPLLQLRTFANSTFATAAFLYIVLCAAIFGPYILLPLFYQNVQHLSPFTAGLLFAPQGAGAAITILLSSRLIDRVGGGVLALVGAGLTAVSAIPFLFVDRSTPQWVFVAILGFRGLGLGMVLLSTTSAALASLRREQIADAAPQLNVMQRVGNSIGVALFAAILASRLHGLPAEGVTRADDAAHVAAFHYTFWWVLALNLLILPPSLRLAQVERQKRRKAHAPVLPEQLIAAPSAASEPASR